MPVAGGPTKQTASAIRVAIRVHDISLGVR